MTAGDAGGPAKGAGDESFPKACSSRAVQLCWSGLGASRKSAHKSAIAWVARSGDGPLHAQGHKFPDPTPFPTGLRF